MNLLSPSHESHAARFPAHQRLQFASAGAGRITSDGTECIRNCHSGAKGCSTVAFAQPGQMQTERDFNQQGEDRSPVQGYVRS